jgi:hypothetical protein
LLLTRGFVCLFVCLDYLLLYSVAIFLVFLRPFSPVCKRKKDGSGTDHSAYNYLRLKRASTVRLGYLRFSYTNRLPADATITRARLRTTLYSDSGNAVGVFSSDDVHEMSADFWPETLGWGDRPTMGNKIGLLSGLSGTGEVWTADLNTNVVIQHLGPNGNGRLSVGLRQNVTTASSSHYHNSREGVSGNARPRLIIDYTVPPVTTGDPTTGVPTTGVPTTGVPTTGVPTTGVPTTGVPTTGVPTTTAVPGSTTTGIPQTTTAVPTTTGTTTSNTSPSPSAKDASSSAAAGMPWWIFAAIGACVLCCLIITLVAALVLRKRRASGKSGDSEASLPDVPNADYHSVRDVKDDSDDGSPSPVIYATAADVIGAEDSPDDVVYADAAAVVGAADA